MYSITIHHSHNCDSKYEGLNLEELMIQIENTLENGWSFKVEVFK